MLDLQYICENKDAVAENCKNRGVQVDLDRLIELRESRNRLIQGGDELRHQQKEVSSEIPKTKDADQKQALIAKGKELREQVSANEAEQKQIEAELKTEQGRIPNMTHPDAPVGGEEDANVLRTWGEKPAFDFEPLDHVALMEKHDLLDLEAGARVAGHGFYFLKNEAVLLETALVQYALGKLRAAGFTLMSTPDIARDEVLEGVGFYSARR